MAGLFSENALMYFLDDKSSIPVGYAGAPVSATRKQRAVLMAGLNERGLNTMDHDNVPQHIIPSVSIKLTPPKVLSNEWYAGKPTIILKDAIFETSTAFRHAAELVKYADEEDRKNPIVFIGTDGGPNHNVTSIQVILSYIALFIEHDLDYLCAVRTPPNFSIINPAERLMCTANIALIGVSLARNHLGSYEQKVRSLLLKKQWRNAQDKHPEVDYRKLARDGLKDSLDVLTHRLESLTYKGEKVFVGEPANDHEITYLKQQISRIWPEIDLSSKVCKSQVLNIGYFREFFDKHTDDSCRFHKSIRLLNDIFNSLMWLHTPQPDGEKYKDFADVHGTEPNDDHVPSKQNSKSSSTTEQPKPPFPLSYTRARKIVICTDCEFPRLLHTKCAIDKTVAAEIDKYIDEKLYIVEHLWNHFRMFSETPSLNAMILFLCTIIKPGLF
ncbi:uncharacterized protein LOC131678503 isoform X1 [Topomyia yanbarensis]|uniref:uncharacterized protein LOC131678503 isoform X1 n=2 Tax=Topomyia yanbarensis TaxID=2498891 RepID=UPI00273B87F9|nr:uncharacterized protein LOC131678503 isoform X1 [Topomyia yanbarensis]